MHRLLSFVSTALPWKVASIAAALFAAGALHAQTWVVTDRAHPVSGQADRLLLLDAAAQIEAELAAKLPADPAQAAGIVQQRLAQGGADLQRRIGKAYQDVADAWSMGITKVPAIVVDKRFVVYGEADVERATARIAQHRKEQP